MGGVEVTSRRAKQKGKLNKLNEQCLKPKNLNQNQNMDTGRRQNDSRTSM